MGNRGHRVISGHRRLFDLLGDAMTRHAKESNPSDQRADQETSHGK